MSTSSTRKPSLINPLTVVVLLVLALGAWTWNWWQISRNAPVQQRMDAAQQFVLAGNHAAAAREWQEAVKLDPDNIEGWQLLSDYHLKAENWRLQCLHCSS
jgi:cytochrome c-type biogenesis protein CcmH/NrfG